MIITVIDFEATSLEPKEARIIEVGAMKVNTKTWELLDELSSLVNPGVPIPEEVQKVTGITQNDLINAPSFAEILPQLNKLQKESDCFVAHNAEYDKNVLYNECSRLGHLDANDELATKQWLCSIADLRHDERITSRKLMHMAVSYGVAVDPSILHRAIEDVRLLVNTLQARGKDFLEDFEYFKAPKVRYQAIVKPPWEDNGVQTNKAKKLGFFFDRDTKSWVADFPQGYDFPDLGFKIVEVNK